MRPPVFAATAAVLAAAARLAAAGLAAAGLAAAGLAATAGADATAPLSVPASLTLASGQCMGASNNVSAAAGWAQQQLQPGAVWSFTRGAGQVVAVLDSGVSAAAPALSGAVLPGLSAVSGGSADSDCTGHGTFVAGLIAARPAAGSGFAGLAPRARILPVDVVGSDGSVTADAVAAGIRFAVNKHATVIDVSPASSPPASAALRSAVSYAASRNVVVIAPVSETQNEENQVSYPAAYPGVVAVCAVASTGEPISAGVSGVRVDLAAPGWNVSGIGPFGRGQITADGAAVATGYVAGTAALVRAYYPQLTAAQVVHRMEATADPPGTVMPSPGTGYGVVDPYTAVTTVLSEEHGGQAPTAAPSSTPRLRPPRQADTWPVTAAMIACGVIVVALIMALSAAHITRHGRRRGWRPPEDPSGWGNRPPRPRAGNRR